MVVNNEKDLHQWHLSVAEGGKVHALQGNHKEALRHYKEAIRIAVSSKSPEVFFRHYTQCVLESLEKSSAFDEIIEYCQQADNHYQELSLDTPFHRKDHAEILERQAIVELKSGKKEEAILTLQRLKELSKDKVPIIANQLIQWLDRRFEISHSCLHQLQIKHDYYVVRKSTVKADSARMLPAMDAQKTVNASQRSSVEMI